MTNTHHAIIIHNNNTITLIAGGNANWCYEQLVDFCCVNPLEDMDEALVVERGQTLQMRDLQIARQKMAAERNLIIMQVERCDIIEEHPEHTYDYEGPWKFCRGEE